MSFNYNKGNCSDDPNGENDIVGFIAEDVERVFPVAAQYNEDGSVEMWNSQIMVPAILKLVQEQNERIKELEKKVLESK